MKTYIIKDKKNIVMGISQDVSRSKALYQCFLSWEKELGLSLLEFSKCMSCTRFKELDDLDFIYFDGRDFEKEYDSNMTIEDIREEVQ